MITHQVETLNELLRGELAATETYQQALSKLNGEAGVDDIRKIHVEHREAANSIRQHVRYLGGVPDHGSGAWGAFAKSVEGTANLFGKTAALKALKEGEESGIRSYEKALESDDLPRELQSLIRDSLLPQTRSHVAILDQVMSKL